MKRHRLLRSLPVLGLAALLWSGPIVGQERTLQQSLVSQVAAKHATTRAPVLAAGLLRSGEIVGLAISDRRDVPPEQKLRAEDTWHFGSNGKSITAVVAGRLVEKGLISFDTTLGAAASSANFEFLEAYREVTLLDLLRHRGGIYNLPPKALSESLRAGGSSLAVQREAMVHDALVTPPASTPKAEFRYSNAGYGVIAWLLERAAGVDFEKLVAREVYEPLGLESAAVGYDLPTRQAGGFVTHLEVDGVLVPKTARGLVAELGLNPFLTAAGGFHMSIADWLAYCNEHIEGARGRGRLLSAATYRTLHTPPQGGSYAAGWEVARSDAAGAPQLLLHNGGGIHLSYAYVDLENELAIVVLADALSGAIHDEIKAFRLELAANLLGADGE
jgi:CubicO group peptidase (beta-lactamase class C family)